MKLIILDRDGVINYDSEHYIKTPDEWRPLPGSLETIAKLKKAGFTVAVATNQSGVGRGYYDLATLNKIHDKMQTALAKHNAQIDLIVFCPHTPDDHCDCRKPKTGLFKQIAQHFQIDLKNIPAVGDSLRDLQAANSVGCLPILVETGNGIKTKAHPDLPKKTRIYANLAEWVEQNMSKAL